MGKQRVQRLMQKHGIQARGKRRFRVVTTDSKHNFPIAPNVLDRKFTVPSIPEFFLAEREARGICDAQINPLRYQSSMRRKPKTQNTYLCLGKPAHILRHVRISL